MARAKKRRNDLGIAAQLRPIAKSLIKEALRVYGDAEEALTEAGEQFEDLVSEARGEMKKSQHQDLTRGTGASPESLPDDLSPVASRVTTIAWY
jgi:hypothetical protein